jgi:hypothetical protein
MALKDDIKGLDESIARLEEAATRLESTFNDIAVELASVARGSEDFSSTIKTAAKDTSDLAKATSKLRGITKDDLKDKKKANDYAKVAAEVARKQRQTQQTISFLEKARVTATEAERENIDKALQGLYASTDAASELSAEYNNIVTAAESLNNLTGFFDTLEETLKTIPGIGPLIAKPFKEAAQAMREVALEGGSFFDIAIAAGDKLAESFGPAFFLGSLFKANQASAELGRALGISAEQSTNLRNNFTSIAVNSDKSYVSTNALSKAMTALAEETGVTAGFTNEQLETTLELTQVMGLENAEAAQALKYSALTGKSEREVTTEILDQVSALESETGIRLDGRQILKEVLKINGQLAANYGFNNKLLAEAVVKVKQFGLTLEQAAEVANNLLDFESSIANEVEAELLTGKQLNLERARLAAINNDLATVASEIAKQVGTAAEFTQMNVIQQEALAKSVGLTREDLAKSLIEREALVKLSAKEGETAQQAFNNLVKEVGLEEAKKRLGDEQLANQLAGQSVQERFTASIEKLKEIFVSLAEPLMPVLDIFAEIAGVVSALVAGPMGQMLKFAATLAKYLLPVYGLYKGILALQSANVAISRVAAIIEAGRLTTLQGQVVARGEENAISKITIFFARLRLLFARQELETQVLTSAQKGAQLGLGGQILVMLGLQNAAEMYKLTLMTGGTTQAAIRAGLEETILGSLILQAGAILSNIGKSTIELGIKMGILSATLATNAALTFGVGVAVAVAAAVAGFAAIKALTADDMVSPQGYGKRTLLAPEGAIQLNDKDTVIAGTDLGGGTPAPSGGGSVNMAPLVAELQAIKTLLNTVLTKEGTISINGTTVATAIYPDIQRMSRLKDFKTQ